MTHTHLMRRLSLMPGKGSPVDWLEASGPVVNSILIQAGDMAGLLVERAQVELEWRPTPFVLTSLLNTMKREKGETEADTRRARSARCHCGGGGMKTIYVEIMKGPRGYCTPKVETRVAACSCPQGDRIHGADVTPPWASVVEWEINTRRRIVPDDGTMAGPTRYWVDDGMSAPPEWTRPRATR